MNELRTAVIGCGAVAERVHLPALARLDDASVCMLVDRSPDRARLLADAFHVERVALDYHEIVGHVDAAIVGVPHHLHAPIAIDLLEAGVHVLVEKPMALTPEDCARMNDAARRSGRVLAVGLLRRCSPALRWVKHALDARALGRVTSFDLREGSVYRWPVASDAMFRPEAGGVLADAGAHVLDLVLWWFGSWHSVAYKDDERGGVEANCLIELEMTSGARGHVELSRTRELCNSCIIRGERATLEVGTKADAVISVRWNGGEMLSGRATTGSGAAPATAADLFVTQFEQFQRAITLGVRPLVDGRDALESIELLAACYGARQPWIMPWDARPARAPRLALAGADR